MKNQIVLIFLFSTIFNQQIYEISNETKLESNLLKFGDDEYNVIELVVGSGNEKNYSLTKVKGAVDLQVSETLIGIKEAGSNFGISCATSKSKISNSCLLYQGENSFNYRGSIYDGRDATIYLRVNETSFLKSNLFIDRYVSK